MYEFTQNKPIKVKATTNTGSTNPLVTITNFEWTLDDQILPQTTDAFDIDPATLNLGVHTLSLRVQNSAPCNKWSDKYIQTINIVKGDIMEQTDEIDIKSNNPSIVITLRRKTNVTVTVMEDPNMANQPYSGATVNIGGISGTTDSNGKVILNAVPMGHYTVKTTFT